MSNDYAVFNLLRSYSMGISVHAQRDVVPGSQQCVIPRGGGYCMRVRRARRRARAAIIGDRASGSDLAANRSAVRGGGVVAYICIRSVL